MTLFIEREASHARSIRHFLSLLSVLSSILQNVTPIRRKE
jgi:hypothetical protein